MEAKWKKKKKNSLKSFFKKDVCRKYFLSWIPDNFVNKFPGRRILIVRMICLTQVVLDLIQGPDNLYFIKDTPINLST